MSSAATATATLPNELEVFCQQNPAEAAKRITELEKSLEWHQAYKNKMHEIITNKTMSYSDRVFWAVTLKNHPDDMIALKPFQTNVWRLRQESGLSSDSATKSLRSMQEARAIRYSNKPQENEETGEFTSVSTIVPLENYTQANTKAAASRIKQREEVKKRRARKLETAPCESCGSADPKHAYANIVPHCRNCGHIASNQLERHPAKNIRIIEEEVIPPSHEFSDTEEWIEEDNDTETLATREQEEITSEKDHEFSEVPDYTPVATNSTPDETESIATPIGTNNLPSHEFSASATDTPSGAGNAHAITQTESGSAPSHEFSDTTSPDSTFTNDAVVEEFIRRMESAIEIDEISNNLPNHEFSASATDTPDGAKNTNPITQINEEVIPQEGTSPVPTIREEIDTPSSHEFSEAQDSAPSGDGDTHTITQTEETTDGKAKFSVSAASTPSGAENTDTVIQTNEETNSPPSHEFSEGMRVVTPNGMGTISYIGMVHGKTRYRVRTNTLQRDGTYYITCCAREMQPIVQASLL